MYDDNSSTQLYSGTPFINIDWLFLARVSNHLPCILIMKLFIRSQTSAATVEIWEWMGNYISRFIMDVTTYLCWDLN